MRSLCLLLLFLATACTAADDNATDDTPDSGQPSSAVPDYAALFPLDRVADVRIDFHGEGWATITATPLEDIYVPADITWDGVTVTDVMVRLKGNSSRKGVIETGSHRFSLKIDFDALVPDQTLHGVDKLNLNNGWNDPTQLREVLATELFAAAGVPSPQMGFAQLTIDGDLIGTYVAVEQVERDFLRRHFADDAGDLYKPEPPAGHLAYRADGTIDFAQLDLQTNEDSSDHAAMIALLDTLAARDEPGFEQALEQVLDVDRYLRYLAVSALIVNLDSPLGPGHNFYLYEDRAAAGRFAIVPWDMNGTFATFSCGYSTTQLAALSYDQPWCVAPPESTNQLLPRTLLANPTWLDRYHEILDELTATVFVPEVLDARIAELAAVIRDYVHADPTRQYPADMFETGLTDDVPAGNRILFGLESIIDQRLAELELQR